ncbi:MAG: AhpC/TSA family protein [Saprospiraceae bacterium]|nr:AhpC/TSA family protein [Saprospiraceae bacterium]
MKKLSSFALLVMAFISMAFAWNSPQNNERLKSGDKAPSIKTEDVLGNTINVKKMVKDQKVLLVFLRHAWCPICNNRTHELIQNYDALKKKGYEVIVFYQSPKDRLIRYVEDYKLPFRVVADPDQVYYKMYELEFDQKKVLAESKNNEVTTALKKKGMKLIGGKKGIKKYKTGKEKGMDLIPGDFVIGKKETIEKAFYGKFLGDHLALDDL